MEGTGSGSVEEVKDKHLLAVFEQEPFDVIDSRSSSPFRLYNSEFIDSLTPDTRVILRAHGKVGNLKGDFENNRHCLDGNHRYFEIYKGADIEKVNKDFFALHEKRAILEIPDTLRVVRIYHEMEKKHGKVIAKGSLEEKDNKGGIEEIVALFRKIAKSPLVYALKESRLLSKNLTKKRLAKGSVKMPVYFAFGLETSDGKYLLNFSELLGPYHGRLREKTFLDIQQLLNDGFHDIFKDIR